jgi:HlyD family secretion protein
MAAGIKKYFQFLMIIILLPYCGKKSEKINPVKENITETVYASGIVKSTDQYQVFSPVNGLIKKIFVKENDLVKKGDPLLQVNAEAAQLNTQNAELALTYGSVNANMDKLNEAQTNIDFLKSKIKNDSVLMQRQQNLWNQGIGTRNDLEQRELAFKNDVASFNAAIFRYKDLKKQLNFTQSQSRNNLQISKTITGDYTIKSNADGKVYTIAKKNGEMITTQIPVAVIGGAGDFILELQVDEYDIEKIKTGQKIFITMDSYRSKTYQATVTRIIPYMNERTRSFTIEAAFETKPPVLYPNLSVEANIIIRTKENAVTIPREYLFNDSLVLLAGNKKRIVVTGLKDYQKVEIVSGLTPNDQIVKAAQ